VLALVPLIALTYLELSHVCGVGRCGAGTIAGNRLAPPRACELVAGQSTFWDAFLAASLRTARLVINADLSNNP
jgi:hypothetical protein